MHSNKIQTEVAIGGKISNHKGVNIPNILIKTSPLTKKDILDLDLCVDLSLDYIALSFVQRPTDILKLRKIVKNTAIMTKFEKPLAIEKMEEILKYSDAAMVARGDLG